LALNISWLSSATKPRGINHRRRDVSPAGRKPVAAAGFAASKPHFGRIDAALAYAA